MYSVYPLNPQNKWKILNIFMAPFNLQISSIFYENSFELVNPYGVTGKKVKRRLFESHGQGLGELTHFVLT